MPHIARGRLKLHTPPADIPEVVRIGRHDLRVAPPHRFREASRRIARRHLQGVVRQIGNHAQLRKQAVMRPGHVRWNEQAAPLVHTVTHLGQRPGTAGSQIKLDLTEDVLLDIHVDLIPHLLGTVPHPRQLRIHLDPERQRHIHRVEQAQDMHFLRRADFHPRQKRQPRTAARLGAGRRVQSRVVVGQRDSVHPGRRRSSGDRRRRHLQRATGRYAGMNVQIQFHEPPETDRNAASNLIDAWYWLSFVCRSRMPSRRAAASMSGGASRPLVRITA